MEKINDINCISKDYRKIKMTQESWAPGLFLAYFCFGTTDGANEENSCNYRVSNAGDREGCIDKVGGKMHMSGDATMGRWSDNCLLFDF